MVFLWVSGVWVIAGVFVFVYDEFVFYRSRTVLYEKTDFSIIKGLGKA